MASVITNDHNWEVRFIGGFSEGPGEGLKKFSRSSSRLDQPSAVEGRPDDGKIKDSKMQRAIVMHALRIIS
jgi:hypothetical protein